MPEKSALMFYHNFYPKPKIDLEDAKISEEIDKTYSTATGLQQHSK